MLIKPPKQRYYSAKTSYQLDNAAKRNRFHGRETAGAACAPFGLCGSSPQQRGGSGAAAFAAAA